VVVGDGPFRDELERRLEGQPCTFTGFLEGDELLTAFASADVKLFPSTTDTWGNAPLEAQASGLPVIVSDQGGPQELVLDEVTGYVVRGRDVDALHAAMCQLLDDTARREMGRRARDFALQGVLDEPFSAILDSQRYRRRVKAAKKLAKRVAAEEPVDAAAFLDTYLVDHRESLDQEVGA
jgi:glycosyltransferase involved in cell wall biosynthesis